MSGTSPNDLDIPEPRSHDAVAQLQGRRVTLRPVNALDYDFLHAISLAPSNLISWRYRGATPSPEGFVQSLWQGVLTQFMITRPATGAQLGLISAYNADLRSGTTRVAMIVAPDYEKQGWLMDAIAIFLGYLFETWNLRKVYYETIEFNYTRVASGVNTRFHVEGCMKYHEFHDGKYWHVYTLAVYKEEWAERARRVLPYVLGRPQPDGAMGGGR